MNTLQGWQSLVEHFRNNEFTFRSEESDHRLEATFTLKNSSLHAILHVEEDDEMLQMFCVIPFRVTAEKRAVISELLTRLNYGIKLGKFEMDWRDGELRYQASVIYANSCLADATIARLIKTVLITADHFLPALLSVLHWGKDPAAAADQGREALMERPSGQSHTPVLHHSRAGLN